VARSLPVKFGRHYRDFGDRAQPFLKPRDGRLDYCPVAITGNSLAGTAGVFSGTEEDVRYDPKEVTGRVLGFFERYSGRR
jgi:hypothetical protein